MNEKELRARIVDLSVEIEKCSNDLTKLLSGSPEDYNANIGKCYVTNGKFTNNTHEAFRIISVHSTHDGCTFADCIVVTYRGIERIKFDVWGYGHYSAIASGFVRIIDGYDEISREEFDKIFAAKVNSLTTA